MSHKASSLLKLSQNFRMSMANCSGDAGAIRGAGGAFSKKEAAEEERYFRKLQAEQLKKMKQEEIAFHENEIKKLKDSVAAHEKRMENLQSKQH